MSGDFESRLQNAIRRGERRAEHVADARRLQELSEDELKRMHTSFRLSLSDRIESAVGKVADHFPGFRTEGLFGEGGWGTACYRDDLKINSGRRTNLYSRLEVVIRPFTDSHVLDLKAKGTVANREIFNRSYFEKLAEADEDQFLNLIDTWAIEFAELYASAK